MIRRFTVRNFKSLEDVSVDLEPVTVLVGRSGTGKTNFVTALRFLRDFLATGHAGVKGYGAWPQLLSATQGSARAEFEVEFEVRGVGACFTYRLVLHESGPGAPVHEESLLLGKNVLFHQVSGKWHSEPQVTPLPQPGLPVIGRIPSISDVVIAYTALTTGIGCYEFPAGVLSATQQGLQPAKRHPQATPGLHDDAGDYLRVLKDIASNLQDLSVRKNIIAALRCLNPTITAVELDSIQNPQDVVVAHTASGKTLSFSLGQESGGFRRFYAHLLALYQQPPKQTLIFEEPENGVYPGALALLADEFNAAPAAGRGQVILTTHSPELLDHFSADQIRVVEIDGFRTHIGKISREQQEAVQERLLEPGELLTVDPARISQTEPANG